MSLFQPRLLRLAGLLLFAILPAAAQQQGTILGIVFDAANGNPLPQVTVEISGPTSVAAKTDTDGSYTVKVPPGTYSAKLSSPNHLSTTIDGIVVTAGQVADGSTVMSKAGEVTEVEVTATVEVETASAVALLTERKLADRVQDSISAEEIQEGTASDAAGALTKVTGVSLVGEGYVYVRGLGERYSATSLNNTMLATTEPERRVVPLDLFPANLIDNIKVLKTYSPDLPGEFSAGLVQVETTEFPSQPTFSVSYSVGFNSQTQGKRFLDYPGGDLDFFGFDDGTRELPEFIPRDTRIDRGNFTAEELQELGRRFDNEWELEPIADLSRPSQSVNLVAGSSFGKLGLVGAVTFSNGLRTIPNQDRIFYQPNPDAAAGRADPNEVPPLPENIFVYDESNVNARLGAIFNVSYRFNEQHKISSKNFLSRDSDNESRFYTGFHQDFGFDIENQRLRWIERQIFSTQIEGEHLFTGLNNSILSWRYGFSNARRDEPNLRENVYVFNDVREEFEFFDDSQSAFRMFNDLDENIQNPQVDFMTPFYKGGFSGSVKFGVNASFRERDFRSRRLRLALRGGRNIDRTLPPNELFADENIRPNGFELAETTRITDAYNGTRDTYGYYGMVDLNLTNKWRATGGLRIEDMDQNVVTFDPFNPQENRQPAPFNVVNYLPAANVTYQATPKQNVRFGYSQTVSRPDFRELALFDFLDIVGGRQTIGNPELRQTTIQNYDARWEYFPGGNQLIAASFFYKTFEDPIERVIQATIGLLTTFANADQANNFGFELEFRRNLNFLSPRLREWSVTTNFTFVDSNIDLTDVEDTVITTLERPMQGQSRYVANAIVEWRKPEYRSTARFYMNYFSERITDVGSLSLPDVFQQGVSTLDAKYELSLREDGRWKLSFSAENLSNPTWLWTQGGEIFQRYKLGRTYEVGTSFRFF